MKTIFRFASLLAAAVMLFACETLSNDLFQLNADKTVLKADGNQSITFNVIYDGVDVTSEVQIMYKDEFGDGIEKTLESVNFSTDKEGIYKFWADYKGVSDTLTVMATANGKAWSLSLSVRNDVIQANGTDYAEFSVILGDRYDVTSGSVIYDSDNNALTSDDFRFATSAAGEYKFWAEYGTLSTYDKKQSDKGMVTVKAISVAIPLSVQDTQESNLSFVHRAFLTQYTGTACGYCPYMIKILKELAADKTIPEKAVLAAVHSYSNADPAYIAAPKVNNYPFLTVDLVTGFSHVSGTAALSSLIDESLATDAKAGMSVNSALYENEGVLVVKVAVKAAVDGIFSVGAWLLEDGIEGQQTDYDGIKNSDPLNDYDTHESCVRVADSSAKDSWFGYPLGTMKAGEVLEKIFVMDVKKAWKTENLHLAVFASYGDKIGNKVNYSVCNVVDAPIDAPTPFEYK